MQVTVELLLFKEALLCGLMHVRVDFRTTPTDAPPPGITAVPVQIRFARAIVPPTVTPPANVELCVLASPSHASVSAVELFVFAEFGILVSQN